MPIMGLQAQRIPDKELTWEKLTGCMPQGTCLELFLKVEEDPVLTQLGQDELEDLLKTGIEQLQLGSDVDGTLKLKLLFLIDKPLCLNEIGYVGLSLKRAQIETLSKLFNSIENFEYGRQRNKIVNCAGILYVDIKEGQYESLKNINFQFN